MNLMATYYFDKIEDIPYKLFEENNIEGILIDLDNTLTNMKVELSASKKKWVEQMQKQGISFCIVSNTSNEYKVEKIRKELDILGFFGAKKPMKKGYLLGERLLGIKKDKLIMIGDQVFTDIYGANRVGVKSILVKPFDKTEPWVVKMKRPIENMIMKRKINRRWTYNDDK